MTFYYIIIIREKSAFKGGKRCIQGPGQGLGDTGIDNHIYPLFDKMVLTKVLPDTVKDYDGGVDRVTQDRQHTGDKGITYRQSCNGIYRKNYKDIME